MNVTSAINSIINTKWGISRWLRLGIGTAFLVDSFYKNSEMVAFMGAFLIYQAVFNVGCGFGKACDAAPNKSKNPNDISHNFIPLNYKK